MAVQVHTHSHPFDFDWQVRIVVSRANRRKYQRILNAQIFASESGDRRLVYAIEVPEQK